LARGRRGTVLILVAGMCALLASLALAFLMRMRSDAAETDSAVNEAQAHIMLMAACNYIQETSRIGWDATPLPTSPSISQDTGWQHAEGFGWVDVRDGSLGPKNQWGALVWAGISNYWADTTIPVAARTALRAPMYVMNRPPFAIQQTVARNPISTTPGDANFGLPLMLKPDPWPVADPTSPTYRADFIGGDTSINQRAFIPTWFRIFRDSASTFIVTCGAGGTRGWQSWTELADPVKGDANERQIFNNDPMLFDDLASTETRLWYRVEWSAAVHSADYQNMQNETSSIDHYIWRGMNATQESRSQPHDANMVGTIRWVQRLQNAPTYW
jgi:hypothetical protein